MDNIWIISGYGFELRAEESFPPQTLPHLIVSATGLPLDLCVSHVSTGSNDGAATGKPGPRVFADLRVDLLRISGPTWVCLKIWGTPKYIDESELCEVQFMG